MEIYQILNEEAKWHYVSEQTHVDIRDLYQDYLENEAKQFDRINDVCFDSLNPNGIRVINFADVWIILYTKAIGINPHDAEIYYKRASFYEIRGKQDEAIADYSEAVNLKPDYTNAYLRRALCYIKKGLKDEALNDYNTILRINPEYGNMACLFGFVTKPFAVDII